MVSQTIQTLDHSLSVLFSHLNSFLLVTVLPFTVTNANWPWSRDISAVWTISFKIRVKINIHVKEHLSVCFCWLCVLEEHFSTALNFAFISLKSTVEGTKLCRLLWRKNPNTPLRKPVILSGGGGVRIKMVLLIRGGGKNQSFWYTNCTTMILIRAWTTKTYHGLNISRSIRQLRH